MHSIQQSKDKSQAKIKEVISQVEGLLDQSSDQHIIVLCLLALSVCLKDETPYMFKFIH
jgi:hypothetical protein